MIDRSVVFTCMNALYMLMLHKNAMYFLKRQQGRCCGFGVEERERERDCEVGWLWLLERRYLSDCPFNSNSHPLVLPLQQLLY
jgi:hypothetical protein